MTVDGLRIIHSLELNGSLVLSPSMVYSGCVADTRCIEGIIIERIIPRKIFSLNLIYSDLAAVGKFQGCGTWRSGGVLCPGCDTVLVAQPTSDTGGLAVIRNWSGEFS